MNDKLKEIIINNIFTYLKDIHDDIILILLLGSRSLNLNKSNSDFDINIIFNVNTDIKNLYEKYDKYLEINYDNKIFILDLYFINNEIFNINYLNRPLNDLTFIELSFLTKESILFKKDNYAIDKILSYFIEIGYKYSYLYLDAIKNMLYKKTIDYLPIKFKIYLLLYYCIIHNEEPDFNYLKSIREKNILSNEDNLKIDSLFK